MIGHCLVFQRNAIPQHNYRRTVRKPKHAPITDDLTAAAWRRGAHYLQIIYRDHRCNCIAPINAERNFKLRKEAQAQRLCFAETRNGLQAITAKKQVCLQMMAEQPRSCSDRYKWSPAFNQKKNTGTDNTYEDQNTDRNRANLVVCRKIRWKPHCTHRHTGEFREICAGKKEHTGHQECRRTESACRTKSA